MKKIICLLCAFLILSGCYYVFVPPDEDWLCTIYIDGTNLTEIEHKFQNYMLSPDRETLIEYTSKRLTLVDPTDLDSKTLLINYGENTDAISYPTLYNNYIAYCHDNDIYTISLDNYQINRLTFTENTQFPSISGDGTIIAYSTISDSSSTLVVMDADGSDKNVIFEIDNYNTLKHNIKNILFVSNYQKLFYYMSSQPYNLTPEGLYSINIDGSNMHCILQNVSPVSLSLSSDSTFIVFSYNKFIQRINVDGTGYMILGESSNDFFDPVITPNNEKILFDCDDTPYLMNVDGTNRFRMVDEQIGEIFEAHQEAFFLNDYMVLMIFCFEF